MLNYMIVSLNVINGRKNSHWDNTFTWIGNIIIKSGYRYLNYPVDGLQQLVRGEGEGNQIKLLQLVSH